MEVFDLLREFFWYAVVAVICAVIALVLLRFAINYGNINPFGRTALSIRRYADTLINPVRNGLLNYGIDPKFAPLLTILITILAGYFFLQLVDNVVFTTEGVTKSLLDGKPLALVGHLLYGLLAIYALLIIVRVIFSWGMSYSHPLMRFLVRMTEPLLAPARRVIPTLGMMDISPIIVIFMLQLFQAAIARTLLR